MLEKIVTIKSIGRFRNYSASGDVAFRRLTLIYAENGQGKTTLCGILRSLQSGQKEFITERKTLAAVDSEFVHLRINNANYNFTNGAWTQAHPDLAVFDSVFVNENVYSGDYVDHEHKKNLYRVIVGPQGVQLVRQIEQLDGQIRDASADIRSKKEAVSQYMPADVALNDYLQWQPSANIDAQIQQKQKDLKDRQRAAAKSDEIRAKGTLVKVELPSLPTDFPSILKKELTEIAADAETKVHEQIARHQMGHYGEAWLSQGLAYVKDDRCPFCGQDVHGNDLISYYNSYFGIAYKGLKEEVSQLDLRIRSAIGEESLVPVQQAITTNGSLTEFWKQFTTVEVPDVLFQDIQYAYTTLREKALALSGSKQARPLEAIAPDEDFTAALAVVETLRQHMATYNEAVDAVNLRINMQKATAGSQDTIAALTEELARLEARKGRFLPGASQACQAYQSVTAEKKNLEQAKKSARQQLDQHCQNLLQTYQESINDFLDKFNAGFRIMNTRHLYTGGAPSSHYQIEINNTPLDLGDSRTPAGRPCFKTALSSGDRSALALAFFLSVLKQDANIGQKIVVFDDPFTSLDRFRRICTQQVIHRILNSAQQVIVLSHDPYFLKLLSDDCPLPAGEVKTLQMSKSGGAAVIGEWDMVAGTQSSYLKDYSTLLGFYQERKGDPRSVARAIRPFLEGMLRSHFPGHFQSNEWLGDFINKIQAAGPNDGLFHAKADVVEIDAINNYSKKYHHQQTGDTEPVIDDELHGFVKRTLRLVGGA